MRIIPVPESVLIPTITKNINYYELDIKLSRFDALNIDEDINCLLLGSSVVDYGLSPSVLNKQLADAGMQDPVCFNMGLRGMPSETTSEIASIIVKRSNPSLVILGVSPLDFADSNSVTRDFVNSPWFRYQKGIFSIEGSLIEHSMAYKYWLSFLKYRNPAYRGELENQLLLIDRYGLQAREESETVFQVDPDRKKIDFQISRRDMDGLLHIADMNSSTLRVIVVEMPVHPDLLPYYVLGGEGGYEEKFIQPIQKALDEKGIPFIRTQPQIKSIVSPNGWNDEIHLNEAGTEQFSHGWRRKFLPTIRANCD
ncbi:MAG: hypothetical protein AB9891_18090 [Anaerolineaceae bacterium]